jgi:transcriptional regulator with XRE-family HTH domain
MERTKLAAARYEKGWSQEEVAERVGVTRNTFSKWERGIVVPYPIHVHRLCEVYGKSAS